MSDGRSSARIGLVTEAFANRPLVDVMNWLGRELDRSSGDDARRASAAPTLTAS